MSIGPDLATSADVLALTGCTYRQLDHWLRRGYVSCLAANPGSGHGRQFTGRQVLHVGLVTGLVQAGFPPQMAATVARRVVWSAEGWTLRLPSGLVLSGST